MSLSIESILFSLQSIIILRSVYHNLIDPVAHSKRRHEYFKKIGSERLLFRTILQSVTASIFYSVTGYLADLSLLWYSFSGFFIISAIMSALGYSSIIFNNLPSPSIGKQTSDIKIKKRAKKILAFQVFVSIAWIYSWRNLITSILKFL